MSLVCHLRTSNLYSGKRISFYLISLPSSRTMLSVCRIFRGYRGPHILSVFSCRPQTATVRTRLPFTQGQSSSHITLPARRFSFNSYKREFSTSSSVRTDAVGKIQSTHYHLIYTCKVLLSQRLCSCCFPSENVDETFFLRPVSLSCVSV